MASEVDSWYSRSGGTVGRRAALRGAQQADVCVVGGGLAGLATALELAERGRSVVVLERHEVGWGASGRSGGFVTPGFPDGAESLVAKIGIPDARELYGLNMVAHQRVRAMIENYQIGCGRSEGQLRCALVNSRDSVEAYCAEIERNFGLRFEYWAKDRVADVLSSPMYRDAFYNPYTFTVDPLALTRGLARAAESRGVRIFERSPAVSVSAGRVSRSVRSSEGEVSADAIVIAGGAYVRGLLRRVGWATVPIATFILATKPLGERLRRAIRLSCAISDLSAATSYYRPLPDGRLLWGGRVQAWEPGPERIAKDLYRDMVAFYPALEGAEVEVAWSGLMPYLRHCMPFVGRVAEGFWAATGFGGLGLVLTTLAGQLISAAIDEGDDRWRLLARFGLPFAGGKLGRIPAQMSYWHHSRR